MPKRGVVCVCVCVWCKCALAMKNGTSMTIGGGHMSRGRNCV